MKNKLILIILLLPSCVQPILVQQTKPSISNSHNISNIQTTKVVESVKPQQTPEVKTSLLQNIVESDGNLATKITDIIPTPIPTPTPSPTGTSTTYTNTSNSPSPSVYDSPIKPEDRGTGQPATSCDAYGQESTQCKNYLNSLKQSPPPYNDIRDVPNGLTNSIVTITFKDEYKIRYKATESKFISLIGTDISSVNNLIITDKLVTSTLYENTFPEGMAEDTEIASSKNCNCDIRNVNSMYNFRVNNLDVKEFIFKLRDNSFIRDANVILGSSGVAGYIAIPQ